MALLFWQHLCDQVSNAVKKKNEEKKTRKDGESPPLPEA
jgi:hypothetical protein